MDAVRVPDWGKLDRVRWTSLFDDLEAQLEAQEEADLLAETRDRARSEVGRIRLTDRLRAATAREITVTLVDGRRLRGRPDRVGADWLLLAADDGLTSAHAGTDEAPGQELLVPLAAVLTVHGLDRRSREPGSEGLVAQRLDLRSALRGLSRTRVRVRLVLAGGAVVGGVLDRVAADHVDVVEDPRDRVGGLVVPLGALLLVSSGGSVG